MKNLFISGITGKVGKLLSSYALESNQFKLVGGSCSPDSTFIEKDVGELLETEEKTIIAVVMEMLNEELVLEKNQLFHINQ